MLYPVVNQRFERFRIIDRRNGQKATLLGRLNSIGFHPGGIESRDLSVLRENGAQPADTHFDGLRDHIIKPGLFQRRKKIVKVRFGSLRPGRLIDFKLPGLAAFANQPCLPLSVTTVEGTNDRALRQTQNIDEIIHLGALKRHHRTSRQGGTEKQALALDVTRRLDHGGEVSSGRASTQASSLTLAATVGTNPDMAEPVANIAEFTVSEISMAVKRTVEESFGYVRVRGEISGYRGPHSSGHAYFAMKDDKARLEAVVWRGVFGKLKFKPEEGLEVIATGRLTTYPGSSKYQIVIESLEPAGVGALMALLEERRKKLAAEGLFDESRKRPLPYLPRVVGVVTSPTGAVIRDILHRLADRFPVHVEIWPVRVQGETSAAEVAAAIEGFNALEPGGAIARPDVLIIARGGGSLEDLWGFNEEAVVRAAAASEIPVISAIGHETDWTLIDHVADRRAPTPTGAAEMVVPVRSELIATLESVGGRLSGSVFRLVESRRRELRAAARVLPRAEDLFAIPRRTFDELASRLGRALVANSQVHRTRFERASARLSPGNLKRLIDGARDQVTALAGRGNRAIGQRIDRDRARQISLAKLLDAFSYRKILERGFALVTSDGAPMRSAASVKSGAPLDIEFHDGHIVAVAGGGETKAKTGRKPGPPKGSQGNLF